MFLTQLPRPTIFAHRGSSAYAPENTLAAFELALGQGSDGVELDAKLTADGHVVVIHDQTVDRTTNHRGHVKDLTLGELRQMDAGCHFDASFRGEPIPALEEVFVAIGQRTFINVELTNYSSLTDELPEKVAALVVEHSLAQRVLFSSFNPIALRRIHSLLPKAPIGFLTLPGWLGSLARFIFSPFVAHQSLNLALNSVNMNLVKITHQKGRKVFVYTVNQKQDMERLFTMGVDGIFTDDPVLARQVLSVSKPNQNQITD